MLINACRSAYLSLYISYYEWNLIELLSLIYIYQVAMAMTILIHISEQVILKTLQLDSCWFEYIFRTLTDAAKLLFMGHTTLVFQHRGLQSALFRQPLLTLIIHNLLVFIIDAQSL